ncbi:MAG: hypothetical protein HDQ96_07135 [Lachnospiraceae bacterium]|nr:hypothetical protein [Lachnospiraceae bacterium]
MNGNHNQNNMGERIKDAVADALQSGDFKVLNNLVAQTVTDTLNEVGKQIAKGTVSSEDISKWKQKAEERKKQEENRRDRQEQFRREEERRRQEHFRKEQFRYKEQFREVQFKYREQSGQPEQFTCRQSSASVPAVRKNKVGSVSGVLYQVFGGIGVGVMGLAMIGRMFLSFIGVSGTLASWGIHLALMAGFAGMIGTGISKWKRLKRADRYIDLCGSKMYGDIEKLAKATGKSDGYVKKDIRKMLKAGMFPEGHLDEQETCFMLNDLVYGQYLEAEKNRRIREEEEKKAAVTGHVPDGQDLSSGPAENSPENELNAMVSEGMECIRKLRDLNDNIEGEVISDKLFRLENLLKEIFDSVREHPEQMHRMHKPMDYYLPTTLKLVEAYEEFDRISVPGEEVLQAKAEIEKTLDIINQAFAELLNNLFQDAVFDATADARVLKSMLAREGLTKEMEFT